VPPHDPAQLPPPQGPQSPGQDVQVSPLAFSQVPLPQLPLAVPQSAGQDVLLSPTPHTPSPHFPALGSPHRAV